MPDHSPTSRHIHHNRIHEFTNSRIAMPQVRDIDSCLNTDMYVVHMIAHFRLNNRTMLPRVRIVHHVIFGLYVYALLVTLISTD